MWKFIFGVILTLLSVFLLFLKIRNIKRIFDFGKNLFNLDELIQWFIENRYIASIFSLMLTGLSTSLNLIDENIQIFGLTFVSLILAFSNLIFIKLNGKIRPQINIFLQIISDLLNLTIMLQLSGGTENPLFISYSFHIFLANILLGRSTAIFVFVSSLLIFSILSLLEFKGIISHHPLNLTEFHGELYKKPMFVLSSIFVLTMVLSVSFYFSSELSESLREKIKSERKAIAELIHASKMTELGEFASVLSHQINNPLTVILMKTKNLLSGSIPENIKGEIKSIDEYTERIFKTTNIILDIVRARKTIKEEFDLRESIKNVLKLIELKSSKKGIKISLEFSEDTPKCYGVQAYIEQAILNILNNAVDSFENLERENKTITIRTFRAKRDKSDYVCAEIKDNGIGIKSEIKEKIFEPFFTSKPKGTGIGLSIAKKIIENENDGIIEFESGYQKGTSFRIFLPVKSNI